MDDEIQQLLTNFSTYDKNGDGVLDKGELDDAVRSVLKATLVQQKTIDSVINDIIDVADEDKDGKLSSAEIRQCFAVDQRLFQAPPATAAAAATGAATSSLGKKRRIDFAAVYAKLPVEKTPQQKKQRMEMFKQFDPNGNGYLSLAEIDKGVRDVLALNDLFDAKPVLIRAYQAARSLAPGTGRDDDYVEKNEFRMLLVYLFNYMKIWEVFSNADNSDDRRLSKEEFAGCYGALQRWAPGMSVDDCWKEICPAEGRQILFTDFAEWAVDWQLKSLLDEPAAATTTTTTTPAAKPENSSSAAAQAASSKPATKKEENKTAPKPQPKPRLVKVDPEKAKKIEAIKSKLMDDEIQQILTNFSTYDKNGDGVLDKGELDDAVRSVLKATLVQQKTIDSVINDIIDVADEDKDGKLSSAEIRQCFSVDQRVIQEAKMKKVGQQAAAAAAASSPGKRGASATRATSSPPKQQGGGTSAGASPQPSPTRSGMAPTTTSAASASAERAGSGSFSRAGSAGAPAAATKPTKAAEERRRKELEKQARTLEAVRNRLMDDEVNQIIFNFARYDKNGDGVLDRAELDEAIRTVLKETRVSEATISEVIDQVIEVADTDGDGRLSIGEIRLAFLADARLQDETHMKQRETQYKRQQQAYQAAAKQAAMEAQLRVTLQKHEDRQAGLPPPPPMNAERVRRIEKIKAKLMDDEIKQIIINFSLYDKNGDGVLDRGELNAAVRAVLQDSKVNDKTIDSIVRDIIDAADEDNDGKLSAVEVQRCFMDGMPKAADLPEPRKHTQPMSAEKAKKIEAIKSKLMDDEIQQILTNFSTYDKNGDGVLDKGELDDAVRSVLKATLVQQKTIDSVINDIIDVADEDKDGKLSSAEIRQCFMFDQRVVQEMYERQAAQQAAFAKASAPDTSAAAASSASGTAQQTSSKKSRIDWAVIYAKLPVERTPEQKTKRMEMFKQFDPNGNGYLSLAEIDKGVRDVLALDDLFDAKPVLIRAHTAAKNLNTKPGRGQDYIEKNEFRMLLVYLFNYMKIWEVFSNADNSDDRRLSKEEFAGCYGALQRWAPGMSVDDCWKEICPAEGRQILFTDFAEWAIDRQLKTLVENPGDE